MAENQIAGITTPPQIDMASAYPKNPIEQSISERLLGDVARTQSDSQVNKIDIKGRFETYGSPAADAVVAFLGKQEIALDEVQNSKENQPVEKKMVVDS